MPSSLNTRSRSAGTSSLTMRPPSLVQVQQPRVSAGASSTAMGVNTGDSGSGRAPGAAAGLAGPPPGAAAAPRHAGGRRAIRAAFSAFNSRHATKPSTSAR